MNDWEYVKQLQALCGQLDFVHIYAQHKLIFLSKFTELENAVLHACFSSFRPSRSSEFTPLCC